MADDDAAAADAPTTRTRSASPARSPPSKKPKPTKSTRGFKWKEKRPDNDDDRANSRGGDDRLHRGYRDRSPRRDSYRDRGRDERGDERDWRSGRDGGRDEGRGEGRGERRWDERRGERERGGGYERSGERRDGRRDERRDDWRGERRDQAPRERDEDGRDGRREHRERGDAEMESGRRGEEGEKKKEKKKKVAAVPVSNEPMIIVNVNDRLGTKAAIPCLASDSIKAFKAVVAAHIGRQPHEIMLKRQGERPFKDQLSLADYGVSNGVQLDLELDTGD